MSPIRAQTIITLNASITTPDTLIIPVTSELIPDTPLMSLVDSGSSDSFIDSGFMEKHHLAAYTIPAIRLCLIDCTCNSIITQAIKLHICFLSGKKQHVNFYVTHLDSSCTLVLRYYWFTQYNPLIDWVHSHIIFCTITPDGGNKSPPVQIPKNPITVKPDPAPPNLSPADWTKPGTTLRVTLINAKAFRHESTMQGSQCFCLQVATPKAVGRSVSTSLVPVSLDGVLEEYHDFTDIFSKYKARVLVDHRPYDLQISLKEGASPPLRPIYSLSQEELLAIHRFIDENTSMGFIHPSWLPHGAPVRFIRKKDSSLCHCCDFWGINQVLKKDQYLLLLINDLLDAPCKAQIYTKIDL